jgi:hypothetical protein
MAGEIQEIGREPFRLDRRTVYRNDKLWTSNRKNAEGATAAHALISLS